MTSQLEGVSGITWKIRSRVRPRTLVMMTRPFLIAGIRSSWIAPEVL